MNTSIKLINTLIPVHSYFLCVFGENISDLLFHKIQVHNIILAVVTMLYIRSSKLINQHFPISPTLEMVKEPPFCALFL